MSFLDNYIPHVQKASKECRSFGDSVLRELRQISLVLRETAPMDPNNQTGTLFYQGITTNQELPQVPIGEVWEVNSIGGSSTWILLANGLDAVWATNQFMPSPYLLQPGQQYVLVPQGGAHDYSIQYTRILTRTPKPHTIMGGEGGYVSGTGTRREQNRDMLQVGVTAPTPPPAYEN